MTLKRKTFFKALLSVGTVAAVIPLAIACSSNSDNSSTTDTNQADVNSAKDSFSKISAADLAVATDKTTAVPYKLDDVNTLDKISAIITGTAPALPSGVTITGATFASVANTPTSLAVTFTFSKGTGDNAKTATQAITITGFNADQVSLALDAVKFLNLTAANLVVPTAQQGNIPSAGTDVDTIAKFNALITGNVTLSEGVTITATPTIAVQTNKTDVKVTLGLTSSKANTVPITGIEVTMTGFTAAAS